MENSINISFIELLLAFLGLLTYLLIEIKKIKRKVSSTFDIWFYFKSNIIELSLSLVCTISLLLFGNELAHFLGVINFEKDAVFFKINAYLSGAVNYGAVKLLLNMFHNNKIINMFKSNNKEDVNN